MGKIYRVGTRKSPLALKQVEEALNILKRFYPFVAVEIIGIQTYGDRDKTTPISDIEGSDFFTKEIDEALLKGDADFAVHSAKDLPDNLREGLFIAAITDSIDLYDVLVSKTGLELSELPYGAKIGTSSLRRKKALKRFRSDFQIVDIRGNIEERLRILDNSTVPDIQHAVQQPDAIVIAAAGLLRLGLGHRITERIPFSILKPHPLQGALAVLAREDNKDLIEFLSVLDSRKVKIA
jgi:hydroxymethylbilane synthase